MNAVPVFREGRGRVINRHWRGLGVALSALVLAGSLFAVPSPTPHYTIREKTPTLTAYTNATIITAPGTTLEGATLICENGVISAVGASLTIPAGAHVVDLSGKTVYPGFIEPFSDYGLPEPERDRSSWSDGQVFEQDRVGGNAWNSAIHSERNCIESFAPDAKSAKSLIGLGFTVARSAQLDGIFRGRSFVASLGEGDANDLTLKTTGAHFMSFDKGQSKMSYPGSVMGSIALIRQTFLDADWYAKARAAYQQDPTQERPEYNAALAALANPAGLEYVFETSDEQGLLRADRIAREFGLTFTHVGSGYEYARLNEVKATGATLILPVDFPDAPEVKTLEDELDVSLARLRHWETAPSNPARVAGAGITFALTTHGPKKIDGFWKNVRAAVKRGLAKETALAALTTIPAKMVGLSDRIGSLAPGKLANFVVTDGDIFEKDTKIHSVYINGKEHEIESKPPQDYRGDYSLSFGDHNWTLKLTGKPEKLKGKLILGGVDTTEVSRSLDEALVRSDRLSFTVKLDTLGFDGSLRFSARRDGETLYGHAVAPSGDFGPWSAKLTAAFDPDAEKEKEKDKKKDAADEGADSETADVDDDAAEKDEEEKFVARLTYPNMAFGWETQPPQEDVLIQNATVWTCDDNGVLQNAGVLIRKGKISAVGVDLAVPSGVRVIDGSGLHVTPGVIDEHSHIAISGGVNECTEAITAEVRIGDVVDSDDISIYRQLSGGVTASQLLHGSCNPIGGQAQVIKLRWGLAPEELKFRAAPPSIKCALGENVKRSNFGDAYTVRYPQSRMGVETIMKDGFRAALENEADWEKFNQLSRSAQQRIIPPRRDLELEALRDIINSEMFIHCHSYVQTEILMLMRLAEEFGFRVGTFTHILEGYKVADEMAAHGAGGSTFSDWWAYKFEVYDAIPYNATLMAEKGVVTSMNSDNSELARRLNQEAGKAVMYGGTDQVEALKMVTLNPAIQLKVDDRVGSLTPGKDADFVIWNANPLSVYAAVEQTWVDGRNYFNRETDLQLREQLKAEKSALIQKALAAGDEGGGGGGGKYKPAAQEWHCDDAFDFWRIAQ
ncbi:MAG TPA: amidohydrolase family protein [candidate division Zixibacteria bacterium]|nr:amidohydrolase family protein [candidate division Zixibacteria bacterium]